MLYSITRMACRRPETSESKFKMPNVKCNIDQILPTLTRNNLKRSQESVKAFKIIENKAIRQINQRQEGNK